MSVFECIFSFSFFCWIYDASLKYLIGIFRCSDNDPGMIQCVLLVIIYSDSVIVFWEKSENSVLFFQMNAVNVHMHFCFLEFILDACFGYSRYIWERKWCLCNWWSSEKSNFVRGSESTTKGTLSTLSGMNTKSKLSCL